MLRQACSSNLRQKEDTSIIGVIRLGSIDSQSQNYDITQTISWETEHRDYLNIKLNTGTLTYRTEHWVYLYIYN